MQTSAFNKAAAWNGVSNASGIKKAKSSVTPEPVKNLNNSHIQWTSVFVLACLSKVTPCKLQNSILFSKTNYAYFFLLSLLKYDI